MYVYIYIIHINTPDVHTVYLKQSLHELQYIFIHVNKLMCQPKTQVVNRTHKYLAYKSTAITKLHNSIPAVINREAKNMHMYMYIIYYRRRNYRSCLVTSRRYTWTLTAWVTYGYKHQVDGKTSLPY